MSPLAAVVCLLLGVAALCVGVGWWVAPGAGVAVAGVALVLIGLTVNTDDKEPAP